MREFLEVEPSDSDDIEHQELLPEQGIPKVQLTRKSSLHLPRILIFCGLVAFLRFIQVVFREPQPTVNITDWNECISYATNSWNLYMKCVAAVPSNSWCYGSILPGRNCTCPNPLVGVAPDDQNWAYAWNVNQELMERASTDLKVVFLGDSITEAWNGMSLGQRTSKFEENRVVFEEELAPRGGLALGIAGDRIRGLLYRLENGILDKVHPKIWWILIGTNDILGHRCGIDQIVAGNIHIVETILQKQPNSMVVINSLLPVGRRIAERTDLLEWDTVYSPINHRLAKYAATKEAKVSFFNATDLFVTNTESGKVQLNTEFLPDSLHPADEGGRVWGTAIAHELDRLPPRQ